jgi:hypothetical protein
MLNVTREKIAMSLFTGAIISLFIFIGNIEKISLNKLFVFLILGTIILISLKIILDSKTDLHFIGNKLRKLLNIK